MFGRRSHQRFTISTSPEGTLRTLCDVLIERVAPEEILVISRHAGVLDDTVTIELGDTGHAPVSVRVAESRPVLSDGAVRHRISLVQAQPSHDFASFVNAAQNQGPLPALAVLARETSVRMLNGSSSGCLLECNRPLEVGSIATLRLDFGLQKLCDDLQVIRCMAVEGSSSYRIGAAFLWTASPSRHSLRLCLGLNADPQRPSVAGH